VSLPKAGIYYSAALFATKLALVKVLKGDLRTVLKKLSSPEF
jgi:hypothetical protein